MGRMAIFLDRDGVINENLPAHVRSWDDFRFLPGALAALRSLAALQVPLVVVTNQAAIGRRLVSREGLQEIHRRMVAEIQQVGGAITDILYCPHESGSRCWCRKPEPGMLLLAAARLDIDLERSVLIGDAATDVLAGQRVGCRTILVQTGRGREALRDLHAGVAAWPTAVARDLAEAAPIAAGLLGGADLWAGDPPRLVPPAEGSSMQLSTDAAD